PKMNGQVVDGGGDFLIVAAERGYLHAQGTSKQLLGLGVLVQVTVKHRQGAQDPAEVGIVASNGFFVDIKRAPENRFGFAVAAEFDQNLAEACEGGGMPLMGRCEGAVTQINKSLCDRQGLRKLTLIGQCLCLIVKCLVFRGLLLSEGFYADGS